MAHIETASSEPLLTVGLPVHNAMPFLPETLESLLRQSFQDFRILAIVDGSKDASLSYLRSIRDERLTVIAQAHSGITFTLNRMLRECKSPWLVRQDADDLAAPHRLEVIARAVTQHPGAGMFYSEAAYYPTRRSVGLFRCTRGTPEQIRAVARAGYVPAICHPSAVLHVEKTIALGGYRGGIACEDADLWWRMALEHDIHYIPEKLLFFRQSQGSLSSLHLRDQALHGLYVQYLLLSRLAGRRAASLSAIEPELAGMLAEDELEAKQELRRFNILMGNGKRLRATGRLLRAVCTSPAYFLRRLRDEWFPPPTIANGLSPALFYQRKDNLWPQHLS